MSYCETTCFEYVEMRRKIKDLEVQVDILKEQVDAWKKRYYAVLRGDNGE
jgi:hypothetical protein